MLEYFTYKRWKKNAAAKKEKEKAKETAVDEPAHASGDLAVPSDASTSKAIAAPVLDEDDEQFLERITSPLEEDEEEEGERPPLPPRVKTPDLSWDSDSESFRALKGKGKGADPTKPDGKKANRFSIFKRGEKKEKDDGLDPNKLAVPEPEVDHEKDDLTRVLDDLNLSARNNKAFSLSADSNELVRSFTVVLKDLVNGVPTAVNDLKSLLDDRDQKIAKNFEKLPKSLKKLVTQLPDKLTSTLAPEILAVAAEAQGLGKDDAGKGGLAGAAKRLLLPKNFADLLTKPGAIVGVLKGIMNALKLRWPAFIGTNVIWSVAVFLLLFVLWYCHKRGREVRLAGENEKPIDGSDRIEELPDDPTLPAPSTSTGPTVVIQPSDDSSTPTPRLPPPPIGEHAPVKQASAQPVAK